MIFLNEPWYVLYSGVFFMIHTGIYTLALVCILEICLSFSFLSSKMRFEYFLKIVERTK